MFKWLKNVFAGEQTAPVEDKTPVSKKPEGLEKESIILAESIKSYLEEKGANNTVAWLVESIIADLNNPKVAELFTDYYEGHCSKKDILDSYEEVVTIKQELIEGLAKLGEYYNPDIVHTIYAEEYAYRLFSERFVLDLLENIATCQVSLKQVHKLVWEEYFDCVKKNLDTKKKAGITEQEAYQPADDIEATIIQLLEADLKARRNE